MWQQWIFFQSNYFNSFMILVLYSWSHFPALCFCSPYKKLHNKADSSLFHIMMLQVHMSNQEAHKYLRHNKPGIRHSEIGIPPRDFVRPQGFQLVSCLIGRDGKQLASSSNQSASYYESLQQEIRRCVELCIIL